MIRQPEIATVFGALDSNAFADGEVPSAHVLRELVRNANRLLARGERIINWPFVTRGLVDGLGSAWLPGSCMGFGEAAWTKILPGPVTVRKKSGLTRGRIVVRACLRANERALMQFVTLGSGGVLDRNASTSSPNVLELVGAASNVWTYYTKDDLPLSDGTHETIAVYMRGELSSTAATGGGTFAAGDVTSVPTFNSFENSSAAWTTSGDTWASLGTNVVFEDHNQNVIAVRAVARMISATHLGFFPALDDPIQFSRVLLGTYRLVQKQRWRIGQIAVYGQDRTV